MRYEKATFAAVLLSIWNALPTQFHTIDPPVVKSN